MSKHSQGSSPIVAELKRALASEVGSEWELGYNGKGVVLEDGRAFAWKVDRMWQPTHPEWVQAHAAELYPDIGHFLTVYRMISGFYYIRSDGTLDHYSMGSDESEKYLIAKYPDIRPKGESNEGDWELE